MKPATACLLVIALLSVQASCKHNRQNSSPACYKGRLEIKALCMNYTISVIEGAIDSSIVAGRWTDEQTGKQYRNAFRLGNPCKLPASLNAGDEFWFTIDSSEQAPCMTCKAYYPTPPRALNISVQQAPCTP